MFFENIVCIFEMCALHSFLYILIGTHFNFGFQSCFSICSFWWALFWTWMPLSMYSETWLLTWINLDYKKIPIHWLPLLFSLFFFNAWWTVLLHWKSRDPLSLDTWTQFILSILPLARLTAGLHDTPYRFYDKWMPFLKYLGPATVNDMLPLRTEEFLLHSLFLVYFPHSHSRYFLCSTFDILFSFSILAYDIINCHSLWGSCF